ncbi:MAG: hypothetical protein ACTSXX_06115 [Candidatus Baldrarchaeia archaeon]
MRKPRSFVMMPLVVLLLITPVFVMAPKMAYALTEPEVVVSGVITKDIIDLSNIWKYVDENGEEEILPYTRNGNITINVENIHFSDPFMNKSVTSFDNSASASAVSTDIFLLQDANEIPYVLIDVYNSTAISASTWYHGKWRFQTNVNLTKDYYLLFVSKLVFNTSDITGIWIEIAMKLIDEGGEDHYVFVRAYTGGTEQARVFDTAVDSDTYEDDVAFEYPAAVNTSHLHVYQIKIQKVNELLSVSCVKIETVDLVLGFQSDASTSSAEVKAKFVVYNIYDKKVMINNIVLNKTQTISVDSNTITSSISIEKIADAQIPFTYSPMPDKYYNDDAMQVKYSWRFNLPDDSALAFENVVVNFTVPSGEVKELFFNSEDKLSLLEGKSEGEQVTLATNITPGQENFVDCLVQYSEDDYYIIAERAGSMWAWWHPRSWLAKLLSLILAIVNIFGGVGATWIKRARARLLTP